jgi:hypothetical protein
MRGSQYPSCNDAGIKGKGLKLHAATNVLRCGNLKMNQGALFRFREPHDTYFGLRLSKCSIVFVRFSTDF